MLPNLLAHLLFIFFVFVFLFFFILYNCSFCLPVCLFVCFFDFPFCETNRFKAMHLTYYRFHFVYLGRQTGSGDKLNPNWFPVVSRLLFNTCTRGASEKERSASRKIGTLARLWDHFQKKHHLNSHKGRSCTCRCSFRIQPDQNISLCNVYFFFNLSPGRERKLEEKETFGLPRHSFRG